MVSMQQWVADTIYDITGTGDAANGSDGCSRQRVGVCFVGRATRNSVVLLKHLQWVPGHSMGME